MNAPAPTTISHAAAPELKASIIVLARSGSKGVPGKNWASVAGRPCIAWTLDAALAARSAAVVAVSTDDPRIAEIAHNMGAVIVQRPAELATDTARVDDALRHAVGFLESRNLSPMFGTRPVVMLYANVPIRPRGLIDHAVELLATSGADSVQSYQPVGKHHPWWTCRVQPDGRVAPWEGDALFNNCFRRQDLPPAQIPDGAITVMTRRALLGEIRGATPGPHAFLGVDRRAVVNPEGSVVDIDSPLDLRVADAMLQDAGMGSRRISA